MDVAADNFANLMASTDQPWIRTLADADNARNNAGQDLPDAATNGIVAGLQAPGKARESYIDPRRLFPTDLVERVDYVV